MINEYAKLRFYGCCHPHLRIFLTLLTIGDRRADKFVKEQHVFDVQLRFVLCIDKFKSKRDCTDNHQTPIFKNFIKPSKKT